MNESKQPIVPYQNVRPNSLYVSRNLYRALGYVSKAQTDDGLQTRDGLAEHIISKWMTEKHPEVIKFMDERDTAEKEFVKKLSPKPPF